MTKRQRASLYARLSVAADAGNMSLDGMIADMRALCDREGLEVLEPVHVDDGKSGGFRDRDEFQAWLNDARQGRCEVLVTPVTDRLTREGLNVAASILDVVEGKDPATGRPSHRPVRLVDCNGLDSLHGDGFRFRFVIQAEVGRAERERIRQRSRDLARRLRHAGRWGGGTPPFGYKAVPNPELNDEGKPRGWVLAIEPEEARHVRAAAEALLTADPVPLNRVARRLNAAGVKPRRAKEWTRQTLTKVLTGDHVMGVAVSNGRPIRDDEGNILSPWPAILTPAEVTTIRAVLAPNPDAPYSGGRRPARLLSTLLTCPGCEGTMQVHHRKSRTQNPDPQVGYRCVTRSQGGTCKSAVSVSATQAEAIVTKRYLSVVSAMPMYVERTIVSDVDELASVEAEIRETLADLATHADADTFAKLQRLQVRRGELSSAEPAWRTEMVATGQTMGEYWRGALVDDRRELLEEAFQEITILPGKRGHKVVDPDRIQTVWREENPAADYE
ncbi:recombinase family protein [Streptomyces sp. SID12501]|uniref:Recombinase family protein n=1 Tax=Streptomyces sp. SID12501 TaxID=2706042 RepID=A0A6B3BZG1_9ACTN|nr:recombinase family protein [Streptomyces sp. SID12501]NEC89847.1 recombinase family protein [Streptomyces sp. SID12501]